MRKYNTVYYLLFVLLIMGSFASMAQNQYGMLLLGVTAALFGVVFLLQLVEVSSNHIHTERKGLQLLELAGLTLLAGILCMRVFYLRFPYVEWVFMMAGIFVILAYVIKAATLPQSTGSKALSWRIVPLYASIMLYLVSMLLVPFLPGWSEPAGMLAFALLLVFLMISFVGRPVLAGGELTTPLKWALRIRDRSLLLAALFLLFTAYMGLSKIGALPKMYSDEYPQAYYDLVIKAETGQAQQGNGQFKHERFKDMYETVVNKHRGKIQQ
ncbi:MAG: hypothetical protein AB7K37_08890 [Cyclobacteriaceae bacterium]